jgi:hypothetical protein
MDPVRNPFAPGAGSPPPELAGRDEIRADVAVRLQRLKLGRAAKSVIMVGLRGVGKTVLLDQTMKDAESKGIHTLRIEAPENQSLPAALAPHLRLALLRLDKLEKSKTLAIKGLKALAGFATKLKVKYNDIEVGLDYPPEAGLADNGDLETDLAALLKQIGLAARSGGTSIAIFIDELQYFPENQLGPLLSALHRCSQEQLPITVVGAGLAHLRGLTGKAKSYAERLFDFIEIGPLSLDAARTALVKPIEKEGASVAEAAIQYVFDQTQGYPYFLQEWGKLMWDCARKAPITKKDAEAATSLAVAALDASFFRVRFDRLTPKEKRYLRAMAELGPGPHRSGEIASIYGTAVEALGPVRAGLIRKGMIWSPTHGDTDFTVPLFDEFMKRIMPGTAGDY